MLQPQKLPGAAAARQGPNGRGRRQDAETEENGELQAVLGHPGHLGHHPHHQGHLGHLTSGFYP